VPKVIPQIKQETTAAAEPSTCGKIGPVRDIVETATGSLLGVAFLFVRRRLFRRPDCRCARKGRPDCDKGLIIFPRARPGLIIRKNNRTEIRDGGRARSKDGARTAHGLKWANEGENNLGYATAPAVFVFTRAIA
jgi:hypothetical protein